jgi:hypothetical protein
MRLRGGAAWGASIAPVVLLLFVAGVQIVLAFTHQLSPWLGGGFGMFATLDGRDWRHVHVTAERPGVEREVPVPASLYDFARRARAFPTDKRLGELAQRTATAAGVRAPATLHVVLWRTSFDRETLAPSSSVLREMTVPLGDPR